MAVDNELQLRLSDVADVLANIPLDDDGNLADPDQAGTYLSVLDHAIRGDCGHMDEEEFNERRRTAYMLHSLYLGFE